MNPVLALLAMAAAAADQSPPQIQQKEIHIEQYAIRKETGPGCAETVMTGMIGTDGRMGLLNVTGKPFSATETRRTVQMLANGAKIETSDSNQLYRDEQGRTRVEQTVDG